ncbi:MAG: apolipoprotein N-acyltransferase [Spirochaetota bacterium]
MSERHISLLQHPRNLRTYGSEVLMLLASVLLFALAFPGFASDWGFGLLGFIVLIPVVAVIRNAPWKVVWFYGWFFGLTSYLAFNYWLASFHPLAIFISPLVFSTYGIVLFPVLKLADSLFPKYGYVVQTIIWIAYEYLSTQGFFGYAYGILGYTQYQFLPFIQIAEIFGIWGVTLLTVFPSFLLGRLLGDVLNGSLSWDRFELAAFFKAHRISWLVYLLLFVASLIFGFATMARHNNEEPDRIWKTALVQHNADSWEGGFTTYQRNFYNLRRMSLQALDAGDPDIIIWSETAFVPAVYWHSNYETNEQMAELVDEFVYFAKNLPVPLLTGNDDGRLEDPDKPPVNPDGSFNRVDYNAVILYENGELVETYRKQHLVPMTEHFPYEDTFPRIHQLLVENEYNFWGYGQEATVFETSDGVTFSTPICFEDIFGYLSAEFVQNGADVIVNMTNDSWSGSVPSQMQHFAMAVFRSVENRRSMVRGTNSGMTSVIDPAGRILTLMEPFVSGWINTEVPIYTYKDTVYTRFVDWFAYLALGLSVLLLAGGSLRAVVTILRERSSRA